MKNLHFMFPFAAFAVVCLAIGIVLAVGSALAISGVVIDGVASCRADDSLCAMAIDLVTVVVGVLSPLAAAVAVIIQFVIGKARK